MIEKKRLNLERENIKRDKKKKFWAKNKGGLS